MPIGLSGETTDLITNETIVVLNDGEWKGTFADFCASNKFEDEEVDAIEEDLEIFGVFKGGGGALAGFTVSVEGKSWT